MRKITSLLMLFLVCVGLNAQVYPINFSANATKGDRYVNSISLNSPKHGSQNIDVSSTKTKVYGDYTSQSFTVAPGETVTPTIGYIGEWMHGYVYIDLDNNGAFDITSVDSDELVSYTFYSATSGDYGTNSLGESKKNDCNAKNPPAFTAPATAGTYYMRFKVDWNNYDPAGNNASGNDIVKNRGSVIDVKLVVEEAGATPDPDPDPTFAVATGVYELKNFDTGQSCSRGYLVHSTSYEGKIKLAESQYPGLTSTQYAFASRTQSGVTPYWYVYNSAKGNTYIFSLANGQFINDGGGDAVTLGATPFPVTIETSGTYLKIKSTKRDAYVTAAVGWGQNMENVRWNNEYNDGGHPYTFNTAAVEVDAAMLATAVAAIEEYEAAPVDAALMTQAIALAEQALAATGVGYPTAECSERAPLATALADAKANSTSQKKYNTLVAALTAFATTANVNMPEAGKAYTFVNVQKNGTKYYLNFTGSDLVISTNAAEATPYVCKSLGGGKFAFVNNAGKFLIVKGKDAGGYSNKGYTDTFDANYCSLTIAKLAGGNVAPASPADIFGYVSVMGLRNDNVQDLYFVIKSNKSYDQAAAAYFNDNFSSAFQLVEAEYPNKPVVNDAAGVEGISSISTFCAPFATVVPNDVEVYIAASDESHYIKLQKVEGEAVPANTGVVLVSKNDALTGKALAMVPATTETLIDATGNLLRADAAAGEYTVDAAVNAYVLGAVDGVAGFYPLSATDRTIKQGKAYLVLDASLSAVKLYFGGDDATGIESVVKTENANAPIFDLSGRRVVNVAKGGIYIQNGKKFIVK